TVTGTLRNRSTTGVASVRRWEQRREEGSEGGAQPVPDERKVEERDRRGPEAARGDGGDGQLTGQETEDGAGDDRQDRLAGRHPPAQPPAGAAQAQRGELRPAGLGAVADDQEDHEERE